MLTASLVQCKHDGERFVKSILRHHMTIRLRSRITLETWLAICATFIAILGLALSIWSAAQQRKHDRLSVKPILSIYFTSSEVGYGWWLSNEGVGPARVAWFEVQVDGKVMNNWDDLLGALGASPETNYVFGIPSRAHYLPSAKINLFSTKDDKVAKLLRNGRSRVDLRACFCSLYEECWVVGYKSAIVARQCQDDSVTSLSMPKQW